MMLSGEFTHKPCSIFTETGLALLYFERKRLVQRFLIQSHLSAFQIFSQNNSIPVTSCLIIFTTDQYFLSKANKNVYWTRS